MGQGFEGRDIFADGVQPEDVERVFGASTESDPSASRESMEVWEENIFKDKGDRPIDDEQIRVVS